MSSECILCFSSCTYRFTLPPALSRSFHGLTPLAGKCLLVPQAVQTQVSGVLRPMYAKLIALLCSFSRFLSVASICSAQHGGFPLPHAMSPMRRPRGRHVRRLSGALASCTLHFWSESCKADALHEESVYSTSVMICVFLMVCPDKSEVN